LTSDLPRTHDMTITLTNTTTLQKDMLRCVSCGKEYPSESVRHICECKEPLEMGLFSGKVRSGGSVWRRFRGFLPCQPSKKLSIFEGDTPGVKAKKLSKEFGVELVLKNETVNPTWSFKDRGTLLSLQRAMDIGVKKVGTVSTGNMGVSVSAYCKRAGLDPVVLVDHDISNEKLNQIAIYGGTVIKVSGDYGDLYYESLKIGKNKNIYFSNSNSPYRIEGYKTISFEIEERSLPDYVVIPTSSGGLFRGVLKGFVEMEKSGILDRMPVPICVQAEGCSPICRAFDSHEKKIKRWHDPDTIASAIANPYPPGGEEVLRKLDDHNGICTTVSNDEMISAQLKIASEGIFSQPASAVGVAAVEKLREKEEIEEGAEVVSIITGSGLKHLFPRPTEHLEFSCDISDLKDLFEKSRKDEIE